MTSKVPPSVSPSRAPVHGRSTNWASCLDPASDGRGGRDDRRGGVHQAGKLPPGGMILYLISPI